MLDLPGKKMRGDGLYAREVNLITDQVKNNYNAFNNSPRIYRPGHPLREPAGIKVKVLNKTGSTVKNRTFRGIKAQAYTASALELSDRILEIDDPDNDDYAEKWVLSAEDIPDNAIGWAYCGGVVSCKINVTDADHGYAEIPETPIGPDFDVLDSAVSGSAQILWKESGTGEKEAVIRFPFKVAAASGIIHFTEFGCADEDNPNDKLSQLTINSPLNPWVEADPLINGTKRYAYAQLETPLVLPTGTTPYLVMFYLPCDPSIRIYTPEDSWPEGDMLYWDHNFRVKPITESFDASEVTWNDRPTVTTTGSSYMFPCWHYIEFDGADMGDYKSAILQAEPGSTYPDVLGTKCNLWAGVGGATYYGFEISAYAESGLTNLWLDDSNVQPDCNGNSFIRPFQT